MQIGEYFFTEIAEKSRRCSEHADILRLAPRGDARQALENHKRGCSDFLGFAAVVAVVVLPLLNALKAPKELAKSGLGIGILVVLFLVSYSLADSSVSMKARSLGENEASVRLIGAGLIMFYIVFVVAMVGLFYSFINKALK